MVLQVAFAEFAKTAQRLLDGCKDAFVSTTSGHVLVTASRTGTPVVAALSDLDLEKTRSRLVAQGFEVHDGCWRPELSLEQETEGLGDIYMAGVAYRTESGPPGIWMDAYASLPTHVQVLKRMYDELLQTGEMAEVSFEEFVRLSDANVVIAGPNELRSFLGEKRSESWWIYRPMWKRLSSCLGQQRWKR